MSFRKIERERKGERERDIKRKFQVFFLIEKKDGRNNTTDRKVNKKERSK